MSKFIPTTAITNPDDREAIFTNSVNVAKISDYFGDEFHVTVVGHDFEVIVQKQDALDGAKVVMQIVNPNTESTLIAMQMLADAINHATQLALQAGWAV
jgi:hypothetical protein